MNDKTTRDEPQLNKRKSFRWIGGCLIAVLSLFLVLAAAFVWFYRSFSVDEHSTLPEVSVVRFNDPFRLKPHCPSILMDSFEVDSVLERVRPPVSMSLSGLLHATQVFGMQMAVTLEEEHRPQVPAIRTILEDSTARKFFGVPPLVATRHGVRCRLTSQRNARFQPACELHPYQLLASLAQAGINTGTEVSISQHSYKVYDLIADAKANFDQGRDEIEWATLALLLYLAPQSEWENKFGDVISIDSLTLKLMATDFEASELACDGIHVLHSLSAVLAVDRQHQILSTSVRRAAGVFIERQLSLVISSQGEDGSLSPLWYLGTDLRDQRQQIEEAQDLRRRTVAATAHHVDWILLLPHRFLPEDGFFQRIADYLLRQMKFVSDEEIHSHYCPYSHAAHILGFFQASNL